MDVKVFLSVLAALLVALCVAGVGYLLHEQWEEYRAQQALNELGEQMKQVVQQSADEMAESQRRQASLDYQRRQHDAYVRAAQWQALQLRPDQQCIGGVVITVHGTVYTQEVENYSAVRCSGRQRLRPPAQ